ncbi:MAG: zinc ribbon domain-containing protein, partial [Lachnospiraceae bacterium]|nr:zinc ribbon domain-containing protein [Lachnospiraceae bacterium]
MERVLRRHSMKFCENCGASLADDALFCDSCGSKVEILDAATSESQDSQKHSDSLSLEENTGKASGISGSKVPGEKSVVCAKEKPAGDGNAGGKQGIGASSHTARGEINKSKGGKGGVILIIAALALVAAAVFYFQNHKPIVQEDGVNSAKTTEDVKSEDESVEIEDEYSEDVEQEVDNAFGQTGYDENIAKADESKADEEALEDEESRENEE